MTRADIERKLERGLVGRIIRFDTVKSVSVIGKVQGLAVEIQNKEVIVIFMLGGVRTERYEADIRYFNENTEILYGDTYNGEKRSIRRILQEN